VFHAVSAFCNAGIGLYPDSLVRYAADPWVNGVFIGLIVMGGLGFVTVVEVYVYGFGRTVGGRRMTRLSLQAQIILAATAIFVVGGAAATLAMEWNHTLAHLPPSARPMAALFHSVTSRTAGFNTIDTAGMGNGMIFITLLLMFVGGAPGSAAGGIKVTTFAALVAMGYARYRGWERPMLFHRSIPPGAIDRAVAILAISTLIVALYCMGLMITETTVGDDWNDRGRFVAILFESVSAFGTVGLSLGETSQLSTVGKLLVTSLMFIGRLGPLTVAMAVARRSHRGAYQYAEENVMVG
jgi:trk system potassium uptake protein TrkH